MSSIFTRLFRRRSISADVREEIESHIRMQADRNRRSGMAPEQALRAARRRFGNVTAVRERLHDFYGFGWVETFIGDVRYAVRGLGRNPAVSLAATLTTAIGVGAVASMFSVLQTLLLAPPPHVQTPERVFRVHMHFPPRAEAEPAVTTALTSYPFYERLAEDADSLESVAAYTRATDLAAGAGPGARMTRAVMVSAGFWGTLGVRPAVGRFLLDPEAHPATGARVVVLGHAFWQRRFDGRPEVLGDTLRIKGQPYEIVGVAPRGFRGVELSDVDLWLPLFAEDDGSSRAVMWHTFGSSSNVVVVGRLKPDVTSAQTEAQLTSLQRTFREESDGPRLQDDAIRVTRLERIRQTRVLLGPVTGGLGSDLRPIPEVRVTAWLVGVAVVLVAIACLNVAGLLLLRAMRRRREIAVRLALGISRWRLARQLLTESLVLALLGGAAAFAVLVLSRAWLQRTILPTMAWEPATIVNPSVLAVAATATLATAFAAGISPLWYVGRDALPAIQGRLLDAPGRRPRLQGALLAAQGALSVMLLVGAGLFLRSLHNAATLDIGLDRDNVVAIRVDFAGAGRSPDDVARFYESALERVSAVPGVTRASLALSVPLRSARGGGNIRLPGTDDRLTTPSGASLFANYVTPGFFETTGMRIRDGRGFLEAERALGQVMVVNETMAELAWPNRSPIGECVYRFEQAACTTVVGVVADARRFSLVAEDPRPYFYAAPVSRRHRAASTPRPDGAWPTSPGPCAATGTIRAGRRCALHSHRDAGRGAESADPALATGRSAVHRVRGARHPAGHDRPLVVGVVRRLAATARVRGAPRRGGEPDQIGDPDNGRRAPDCPDRERGGSADRRRHDAPHRRPAPASLPARPGRVRGRRGRRADRRVPGQPVAGPARVPRQPGGGAPS